MAAVSASSDGVRRFSHLWQLAVDCGEKNPALAKFYLSELNSSLEDNSSTSFAMKYCQHCLTLFRAQNYFVRVLPKRRKNKKQRQKKNNREEKKDNHKKQGEVPKLPRRLNHVRVFCKTCGKHSFCTGQPRSTATPVSKTRDSSNNRTPSQSNNNSSAFSTPQSNNMDQCSTPNVSTSGKKRKRRHNSKLKGILLANEQHNSKSTVASPRLQDFLSSL